jgi:hypothetical protein
MNESKDVESTQMSEEALAEMIFFRMDLIESRLDELEQELTELDARVPRINPNYYYAGEKQP